MAVKVVGQDPEYIFHISCRKCSSRLSYTKNDTHIRNGRDISGGPDGCEWINCPQCMNQVIIRSW